MRLYEVWDRDSFNLIGAYETRTEADALADDDASLVVLVIDDEDEDSAEVARYARARQPSGPRSHQEGAR